MYQWHVHKSNLAQGNPNDQPPAHSQCFPGALNPAFCQIHPTLEPLEISRRDASFHNAHHTKAFCHEHSIWAPQWTSLSQLGMNLSLTRAPNLHVASIDKHATPPLSLILRPSRTVRETARFMGHRFFFGLWERYRGFLNVIPRSPWCASSKNYVNNCELGRKYCENCEDFISILKSLSRIYMALKLSLHDSKHDLWWIFAPLSTLIKNRSKFIIWEPQIALDSCTIMHTYARNSKMFVWYQSFRRSPKVLEGRFPQT